MRALSPPHTACVKPNILFCCYKVKLSNGHPTERPYNNLLKQIINNTLNPVIRGYSTLLIQISTSAFIISRCQTVKNTTFTIIYITFQGAK